MNGQKDFPDLGKLVMMKKLLNVRTARNGAIEFVLKFLLMYLQTKILNGIDTSCVEQR